MHAVLFSNFHVLDKLGSGSLRGVWQLEQLYPCGVRSYDDMNGSYISSMIACTLSVHSVIHIDNFFVLSFVKTI